MMRRLVSILLLFVMSVFSLSSSISDVQNFQITAFLREHSNQNPGGEGSPEYYYHILARNLYNAVNVENGVAVQMGQGTSLYGDTPVPLFRIEYVTNYLDGVGITVNVSPFQLWDSQANSAVTEVTGDYPPQLTTMLKAKAGFTADHDTLSNLDSGGPFVIEPVESWQKPSWKPQYSGAYLSISLNGKEEFQSRDSDSYEWEQIDETVASGAEQKFSFDYMVGRIEGGSWVKTVDNLIVDIWEFQNYTIVGDPGTKKDYIEDGGMITNYIEYSARIDGQGMPVAPAGQRLEYRMNVKIKVENSL